MKLDINTKKSFHNKFCITLQRNVFLKINKNIYEWKGEPYAAPGYGSRSIKESGDLHQCKICGIEVYRVNGLHIIWQRWLENPNYEYWSKKIRGEGK